MVNTSNAARGDEVNGLIARKTAQLRRARDLSFDALAARSDLSKGMLVAIEQGTANPSIATLCKLAATLRVSLTDLLAEDEQPSSAVRVVGPDEANELWRGPKGGIATLLVGSGGPGMLELWQWTLLPGEEFRSKGHPEGTVELLSVTEGSLTVEIDGIDHVIAASHRAVAMTDRPHAYRCRGKRRTSFSMVVHEPGQLKGKGSRGRS